MSGVTAKDFKCLFEIETHSHVVPFVLLKNSDSSFVNNNAIQICNDGSQLTMDNFNSGLLSIHIPILVTDSPESIGMMVNMQESDEQSSSKVVDVLATVVEDVGKEKSVKVINVASQRELPNEYTFAQLYAFFNNADRFKLTKPWESNLQRIEDKLSCQKQSSGKPSAKYKMNKKKTETTTNHTDPLLNLTKVINQVSFEFSNTDLATKVRSPSFVRQIDWLENVWTKDVTISEKGFFPNVKHYLILSATGSFMDFHIDFGGTSVWYHVIKGEKQFLLIKPTTEVLQVYEEWVKKHSNKECSIFLPDYLVEKIDKPKLQGIFSFVTLKEKQTAIIPSGWIHCVFTPTDSIVIGGNFLHAYDIEMQLKVNNMELKSGIITRFRFPCFIPINVYALGMYHNRLKSDNTCKKKTITDCEMDGLQVLIKEFKKWTGLTKTVGNKRLRMAASIKNSISYVTTTNGFRRNDVSSFFQSLTNLVLLHKQHSKDDNESCSFSQQGDFDDYPVCNEFDELRHRVQRKRKHEQLLDSNQHNVTTNNDLDILQIQGGLEEDNTKLSVVGTNFVVDDLVFDDAKRRKLVAVCVAAAAHELFLRKPETYKIIGRLPNRKMDVPYSDIVAKINNIKNNSPELFTRMYRLPPAAFDKTLSIVEYELSAKGQGGANVIPPIIKLCVALRFLAGGSYLDLSFGYNIPENTIHQYIWQALYAIDKADDPFLNNIKSPTQCTAEELERLEKGFASLSNNLLRGTVAAGDGVIFRMNQPTNEEVDHDVTSYFTRKQYYSYGLQAFCDSDCRFVMIASKMSSSTNDNQAYLVTQLSKDIKEGKLPKKYHVVMDEAYPCTEQELSPWRGRNLSPAKDAFNYYLSLNRQVIERAFGMLVQRWGIFWRPMRVAMQH